MSVAVSEMICSKCGASQPEVGGSIAGHPPCLRCGKRVWRFDVVLKESASASSCVWGELIPGGDHDRDWKSRWEAMQRELQLLSCPSTKVMSAKAIFAWRDRLCSFWVQAYHLKDALKDAAPALRLDPKDIENAIKNDPCLALLADLANQDKHQTLSQPPKSGCVPVIGKASGQDVTPQGWTLKVPIEHKGSALDGLDVARAAVAAWREKLKGWGLI